MKVYIAGKIGTSEERHLLERVAEICESMKFKTFLPHRDVGLVKSMKDIKRVFDPFFTGENGRKFGESTGMGLYIVKTVCDNLGHKVEIKSEIEKGTQVSILFKNKKNQ